MSMTHRGTNMLNSSTLSLRPGRYPSTPIPSPHIDRVARLSEKLNDISVYFP